MLYNWFINKHPFFFGLDSEKLRYNFLKYIQFSKFFCSCNIGLNNAINITSIFLRISGFLEVWHKYFQVKAWLVCFYNDFLVQNLWWDHHVLTIILLSFVGGIFPTFSNSVVHFTHLIHHTIKILNVSCFSKDCNIKTIFSEKMIFFSKISLIFFFFRQNCNFNKEKIFFTPKKYGGKGGS